MKSLLKKILIFLLIDFVVLMGILFYPLVFNIGSIFDIVFSNSKETQIIHIVNTSSRKFNVVIALDSNSREEKLIGIKSSQQIKISPQKVEYCEIEYKVDNIVKTYKFNTSLEKDSYYIIFKENNELIFETIEKAM